jgi:CO/xanthine dehydrogenase FAD-binding subunit
VKPAPFDYYRPQSLDEALALLARYGEDAKPLAGGQSLIPAMNFRLATPAVLVDLNEVQDLAYIKNGAGLVRIGGMTRQRDLERSDLIASSAPLITEALPYVAHPAIRNRGTIGGSLAHADPAAELPAVMLALNASFTLSSSGGSREVSASDFFMGLFSTAIQPGELLTEIRIAPAPPRSGCGFQEISRRHGDFALVGAAVIVHVNSERICEHARVALLSVGDRPVLAEHAMKMLVGQQLSSDLIRDAAAAAAAEDIDPTSDIHASAKYRRQLANVLTRRALERAFMRAAPH